MRGDEGPAKAFYQVLQGELDLIGARAGDPKKQAESKDNAADLEKEAAERALKANLTGLAFSGGGIRSATFNLGVIQALCDLELLRSVDYLSTVSGGGYIGSWLTALIHRERKPHMKSRAVERVEARLSTRRDELVHAEDSAVTWLRQHSNYLTPKIGLLTADTWSMVANYLRNFFLNLLVLVSVLAVLPLVPRIVTAISQEQASPWLYPLLSLVLGILATSWIGYSFASLNVEAPAESGGSRKAEKKNEEDPAKDGQPRVGQFKTDEDRTELPEDRRKIRRLKQGFVQWGIVLPLVVAAFFASRSPVSIRATTWSSPSSNRARSRSPSSTPRSTW